MRTNSTEMLCARFRGVGPMGDAVEEFDNALPRQYAGTKHNSNLPSAVRPIVRYSSDR